MKQADIRAIADALLEAFALGTPLAPLPDLDVEGAYEVLREIYHRRLAKGWHAVGRKVGFTNRTIWSRYNVYQPMWAHVWRETLHDAPEGRATLPLAKAAEPRIEPEVVFGLSGPVAPDADAATALRSVAWIAPGFEIVQSHFPGWKFTPAECTAAFGLHRSLVVGPRTPVRDREALAARLPGFELTLRRGDLVVDRGVGANVLGSPALALVHLARVLHEQPYMPALAANELVTTGTITDAWPVKPGETWSSDYGDLGIPGLALYLR